MLSTSITTAKHPPHIAAYVDAAASAIQRRITKLNSECSSERMLAQTGAATALLGLALAANGSRKWLALPGIVGGLFLQHAVQGSCPAMSLAQQLGFRGCAEIEQERTILKGLLHDAMDREAVARFEGEGGAALEPDDEYESASTHQNCY